MGDDDRRRPADPGGFNVPGQARRSVPSPWGKVLIPDDLSELAEEAAQVREELRQSRRRRRWNRVLGFSEDRRHPGIVGPVLIVVLAITVALASLVGSFWPYRSATVGNDGSPTRAVGKRLPQMNLVDASGTRVRLNGIRPSVVLAVDHCKCEKLIADAAAVARQERVTLVVVGEPAAPPLSSGVESDDPGAVRSLGDPRGTLTDTVAPDRTPSDDTATVLLVGPDGVLQQVLTDVRAAEEFGSGVRRLR